MSYLPVHADSPGDEVAENPRDDSSEQSVIQPSDKIELVDVYPMDLPAPDSPGDFPPDANPEEGSPVPAYPENSYPVNSYPETLYPTNRVGIVDAYRNVIIDRQFDVSAGLQPLWMFHAGVIHLDRVTEDSYSMMQNVSAASEQLNASDFNFDWTTGFEFDLISRWWDNDGIEFRVLSTTNLDASKQVPMTATSLQINASPPIFAPNVTQLHGRYRSEMSSWEFNYHHWIARYSTGMIGFRYINLDDDLGVTITSTPTNYDYSALTRNNLYGLQIGWLGGPRVCWGGIIVSAAAKGGVYANAVRHNAALDTGAIALPIRESNTNLSWMAEASLLAELPLTRCLSVTGGYTVLWFDQIAVASDQLPQSDFFNGSGYDDGGTALLHGAVGGIELRF
ncbi:MAG: hypothetical protein P1U77_18055 [Rubripirellula sp.]|nr:hypothetical protein [Rubripirellula sp.]